MRLAINQPFDLETSLMMGQAFRWHQLDAAFYPDRSQWFSGVLGDNLIHIRQTEDGVEYRAGGPNGATDADLSDLLSRYFRLDDDIEAIYADLCARDPQMEKLIEAHRGMRLLRQDPWECLVSYMCSAPASIASIKRCVEAIADGFGYRVKLGEEVRITFPTAERLATDATAAGKMEALGLGLKRAPQIISAAQRVYAGKPDLAVLAEPSVSSVDAVRTLDAFDGIGYKIASCVAMMSLNKTDAFPVDRWILRALVAGNYADCPIPRKRLHDGDHKRIISWAQSYFGPYAGYAGQYLFYNRLGNESNSASHSRQAQQGSLEPDSGAKPARNTSRHQNRSRACPNCGAGIGAVCRYPSGYRYEKGHSERG